MITNFSCNLINVKGFCDGENPFEAWKLSASPGFVNSNVEDALDCCVKYNPMWICFECQWRMKDKKLGGQSLDADLDDYWKNKEDELVKQGE